MKRLFVIAFRNLFESKLRTFLLGGATALMMFLLVLMMGASNGVQNTMVRASTTLSTGHVNVGGFFKASAGRSQPAVTDYPKVEDVIREHVPEVSFMVRRARGGFDRVVSETSSLSNAVIGIRVDDERNLRDRLQLKSGNLDDLKEPGTALVFENQATDLGIQVGDTLTISARTAKGTRNTVDVIVKAIAEDMGWLSAFSTYIHTDTLTKLYRFADTTTGAFFLYLDDERKSVEVAERLRTKLDEAGFELMPPEAKPFWQKTSDVNREDWTGQRLDVTTWRDEIAQLLPMIDGLNTIAGMVTFILSLLILIGLVSALWMAVRRRTREIGTLRAIGMSKWSVRLMVVMEAALLTGIFAIVGALTGVGVALIVNSSKILVNDAAAVFLMSDTIYLAIQPSNILTAIAVIVVVTALFALIPAFRASSIPPVAAMQSAT